MKPTVDRHRLLISVDLTCLEPAGPADASVKQSLGAALMEMWRTSEQPRRLRIDTAAGAFEMESHVEIVEGERGVLIIDNATIRHAVGADDSLLAEARRLLDVELEVRSAQ